MKTLGIILIIISLIVLAFDIGNGIMGSYQYSNQIECYWSLADKASTIQKKAENIDKFVAALENSGLKGQYNAMFLVTPDNSFDYNMEALKTLQNRLHEIEKMDITSFQYQTAIQQITQQEQGEAHAMLSIFEGIWWKINYFWLWDWIGVVQILVSIGLLITGLLVLFFNLEDF